LATAGSPSAANGSWHLSGGGTADLSQVAFNVRIDGSGDAKGSFECLMAGRSAWTLPGFGLTRNMIVHAWPTEGRLVTSSRVEFTGPGQLIADGAEGRPDPCGGVGRCLVTAFPADHRRARRRTPEETLETGHMSLK